MGKNLVSVGVTRWNRDIFVIIVLLNTTAGNVGLAFLILGRWGRGSLAILSGRIDTTQGSLVED